MNLFYFESVCGNELSTVLSSAPEGTISLSPDVSSLGNNDHATCYIGLVASYPNTKVSVTCDSKPSDVVLSVSCEIIWTYVYHSARVFLL